MLTTSEFALLDTQRVANLTKAGNASPPRQAAHSEALLSAIEVFKATACGG